jgi:hypothetical protein
MEGLRLIGRIVMDLLLQLILICSNDLVNLLAVVDEQEGRHSMNLPLRSHILYMGTNNKK